MNAQHEPTWPQVTSQPYAWPLPSLPGKPAPLEALVEGETVSHERGTFFRRRLHLSLAERYGDYRLGEFLQLEPQTAAALARTPPLGDVQLDRMLFLDTETTGLSGGTGTHVFLVGLGYFEQTGSEPHFVLEQCLMRSFGEERALLHYLWEQLNRHDALVTFNGRTFDLPLLHTRFVMSRLRIDFEDWPHFDLLPPARRLWRLAIQSCALQNLERHILRVAREDDVESFLIPAIYHQYLRDGDGRYIQRVFNHNRADILAMVALATRACAMFHASSAEIAPAEHLGLARVYEQMGNDGAAEAAYRAALAGRLPHDLRCRALYGLAMLLKRAGRHDDAATCWQLIADELPAQSVVALVELSKYWEHRRRDPARAHDLVLRARDRWLATLPASERPLPGLWGSRRQALPTAPDDFARRLARLQRKHATPGAVTG